VKVRLVLAGRLPNVIVTLAAVSLGFMIHFTSTGEDRVSASQSNAPRIVIVPRSAASVKSATLKLLIVTEPATSTAIEWKLTSSELVSSEPKTLRSLATSRLDIIVAVSLEFTTRL